MKIEEARALAKKHTTFSTEEREQIMNNSTTRLMLTVVDEKGNKVTQLKTCGELIGTDITNTCAAVREMFADNSSALMASMVIMDMRVAWVPNDDDMDSFTKLVSGEE